VRAADVRIFPRRLPWSKDIRIGRTAGLRAGGRIISCADISNKF